MNTEKKNPNFLNLTTEGCGGIPTAAQAESPR